MKMKQFNRSYFHIELTAIATFLMGFIDAFTYFQFDGTFASAQTGNLVLLSAKLFSGEWADTLSHIWVFAGFAVGAFVGEAVIDRSRPKGIQRYRYYLFIRIGVLLLLALFQSTFSSVLMLFTIGALAGYELTMFRVFRGTPVNNGIMTGNARNMMNNLYRFIFSKNEKAKTDFLNLTAIVIIFVLGAGAGTLLSLHDPKLVLWGAVGISVLALAFTTEKEVD